MTKPFSLPYKQMLERLTGNGAESARQVARETGISQQTLSRWLTEARSLPDVPAKKRTSKTWTIDEKIRVLAEAAKLTGAQLTAMLEREGLLLAALEQWRLALGDDAKASVATTKRMRKLERELARKEKALAEAAALLVLKKSGPPLGGRGRRHRRGERQMILAAIAEAQTAGARIEKACQVIGLSVRTIERWREGPDGDDARQGPHRRPDNALTPHEQARGVAVMTSPEYAALSPKQLVPRLADQGIYLASESTMYRLQHRFELRAPNRMATRSHVTRAATVHRATAPNQVWSWDITYLPTSVRGRSLYLYLVLDVWSRRIVGWRVHERESAELAADMIRHICDDEGVDANGLILHSDNGKAMRGSTMIATLQWLGIIPSFSRPHVSDDNPYSEALFRTLKHGPALPRLPFADVEAARRWVGRFVTWYNADHRHSAIRFVTPDQRHFGSEHAILAKRRALYARAAHEARTMVRRYPQLDSGRSHSAQS